MHGAGNDYVFVDARREKVTNAPAVARSISDRHTGVGSDGMILIAPSRKADFRMIMYNSDGSEGAMCGNGIRCIGKYVYDHRLTKKKVVTVETQCGIVSLDLHVQDGKVDQVTVDMGPARPLTADFHVKADGSQTFLKVKVDEFKGTVVSMDNPHFVIVVPSVDRAPVTTRGPAIETHPHFPSRTNVEFVEVISRKRVRQRTWERGSGETFACGSGACAVAAALAAQGITDRDVRIDLLGGSLRIRHTPDDHLLMTGPAVEVFSGNWPTKKARSR